MPKIFIYINYKELSVLKNKQLEIYDVRRIQELKQIL